VRTDHPRLWMAVPIDCLLVAPLSSRASSDLDVGEAGCQGGRTLRVLSRIGSSQASASSGRPPGEWIQLTWAVVNVLAETFELRRSSRLA
jgi:hypothetical protein